MIISVNNNTAFKAFINIVADTFIHIKAISGYY